VERTADNREVLRSNRSGPTTYFIDAVYYFIGVVF